ncbi:MAG TPA: menaquinone biosynthesis protein [Terriglobia bacterium]|nr:menaquinone biosynthesis protein [Terriglobia bacterium]
MRKPRISIVSYLNSYPLSWGYIWGRQKEQFEPVFSSPSQCADWLAAGMVDVGLIPAIEYQRIPSLKVVPALSLAAKKQVRSVLLLSKLPVTQVRTVALDSSSRTSVSLLQILFRDRFHLQPVMNSVAPNVEVMLQTHDAALVIGDVALKASDHGLFKYDLAEEWRALTGKPFVFAFWGVRKSSQICDPFPFLDSFQQGREHLQEIVSQQSIKLQLPEESLLSYLCDAMNYSLDDENLEGLELFYQSAHRLGLVSELKDIEFLS